MMRGALACMPPPWPLGALLEFPPEVVEQADLAHRVDRRIQRRVGVAPGTGIQCFVGLVNTGQLCFQSIPLRLTALATHT